MPLDRVVRITTDTEADDDRRNLAYWLSRLPEERIRHVEELRRQWYPRVRPDGSEGRVEKVVRIVEAPEI